MNNAYKAQHENRLSQTVYAYNTSQVRQLPAYLSDLFIIYISFARVNPEYCCQLRQPGLTNKQTQQIEGEQNIARKTAIGYDK